MAKIEWYSSAIFWSFCSIAASNTALASLPISLRRLLISAVIVLFSRKVAVVGLSAAGTLGSSSISLVILSSGTAIPASFNICIAPFLSLRPDESFRKSDIL